MTNKVNINHVGRVSCFRFTRFEWVGCLKTYYFWRPNMIIMSFSYFQTFSLVSISLGKQELFSVTWNFILSSRETHQDFLTSLYDVYASDCFVKFTSAVKVTLWIFRQIEGESMDASDERETRLFPDKGTQGRITCCALTAEFLIYATDVSGFQDFCIMPCHSLQNDGFMANSRFANRKVLAHMPVMSTKCGISTPSASPIPCWAALFSIWCSCLSGRYVRMSWSVPFRLPLNLTITCDEKYGQDLERS